METISLGCVCVLHVTLAYESIVLCMCLGNVLNGLEAFHFSISNELEQIIKHPTRVPDRHDHTTNTLDLFFTSYPQNYTYTVSSPLGSSDHCTVSVTSSFTPPPPIPPTQRHLWHFENARRADMSNFLLDFPWNDYCFRTRDPDLVATAVGEVVDSGMRAYIPYSLITFSPSNPWFDCACSSAISDRGGAHRSYQASPSELAHATFISARNRCSAKLRRARSSFRKRKIDKLNSSPTEKCFWSLSKKIFNNFCNSSFPSLIRPDGSIACSPTDKANLFGSYFSANSSLSDSNAPDPPTQPLSNPIPSIINSARKVCRVLRSLKTDKASGPDGVPPRFLKEFAEELMPVHCCLFRLILISCTYPSSWKHAPTPPTIALLLSLRLLLRFSKLCLTPTSSNISNLTISFQITSMSSVRQDLQGIFFPILLILGHPLLGTSENHSSSLLISLRHLTVWHKALLAKLPAYGFTPSFCKLISSFLFNRTKGKRGRIRRKRRTPSRSGRGGRRRSGENAKKPRAPSEKIQERERGAKKTQETRKNPRTEGSERKHHRRNNIGHPLKDTNQTGRGKTRERGPPGEGRKRRHE